MSKPEYGHKMTCTACAVRFYDLSRSPAVCPKCGQEQTRAKPRMTARAVPASRGPAPRWPTRGPAAIAAVLPEAAPIDADASDEADEADEAEDENEDAEEIEVAGDEDDTPKVKHDD